MTPELEIAPLSDAPRDGSDVFLVMDRPHETPRYVLHALRWSTHYSIHGLGGCWSDGLATMSDLDYVGFLRPKAEAEPAKDTRDVDKLDPAWIAAYRDENESLRARFQSAYTERNRLVAFLAALYPASLSADEGDAEAVPSQLKTVYVETPAGQMSWHFLPRDEELFNHLPAFRGQWDGHTTEQKYRRLQTLARMECQRDPARKEVPRGSTREMAGVSEIPGVKSRGGQPAPASDELTACHIAALALMTHEPGRAGFNVPQHILADLIARKLARNYDLFPGCVQITDTGRAALVDAGWRV